MAALPIAVRAMTPMARSCTRPPEPQGSHSHSHLLRHAKTEVALLLHRAALSRQLLVQSGRSVRQAVPQPQCSVGDTHPTRISPNQRLAGGSAACDASSASISSSHSCQPGEPARGVATDLISTHATRSVQRLCNHAVASAWCMQLCCMLQVLGAFQLLQVASAQKGSALRLISRGYDRRRWDGMGWDGMGWGEVGRDGMGRGGMGWAGIQWDGMLGQATPECSAVGAQ